MIVPDATTALRMLADGSMSAVELVSAHLDLIDRRNAEIGAVVATAPERALAEARRVDVDRAAGRPLGPLAGLPMTVKDSFSVEGMPASDGRRSSLVSADSTLDAPAVARLRADGAIVMGKTNVPDELADHQTRSELYGVTRNPWDPARTPGGSSGGSAAAVAAGLTVADLGSDLAGSVRVPAAWSGVFGHVPSHGLVSKRRHLPRPLESRLEPILSTSGPLTRSADDLALLLESLAGPATAGDAAFALRPDTTTGIAGARVLLWSHEGAAVSTEMADALRTLADRLADSGAVVEELTTSGAAPIELFWRLVEAELSGPGGSAGTWSDLEEQAALVEEWERMLAGDAVVLAPAVFGSAPALSEVPQAERVYEIDGVSHPAGPVTSAWAAMVNVRRAPATIVPLGLDRDGLPLGAQIVGRRLDDRRTIGVARLLSEHGLLSAATAPGW